MVSEIVHRLIDGEGEDFRNGLQRVLNRVPRRGSTAEPSFFTYSYLGAVLTLPYTNLNDEIGVKASSVKIVSNETIKFAFKIEKDGKTKLVFRTIAIVGKIDNPQHLTTDELKEASESLDLTQEELNDCEVEGETVHIKDGEVSLEKLEVIGKGELNAETLKTVIRENGPLQEFNPKNSKFKKVKDGVIEKGSLGEALEKFSKGSLKANVGELSDSAKGTKALFENLSKVYRSEIVFDRDDKSNSQKLRLSDYEAPMHGFIHGALAMNFRFEHELHIRVEQAAGKGFVDLVVNSRGREFRAELKGHGNTAKDAKSQSEKQGYDKAPIIYSFGEEQKAETVAMVFSNLGLDPSSGNGLLIKELPVQPKPKGLIELLKEYSEEILDDEGLEKGLKEWCNYKYYSISDSNGGGANTNYFSRSSLGEVLADNSVEKYVLIYGSEEGHVESTDNKMRSGKTRSTENFTSMNEMGITLVFKFTNGKSFSFSIDENLQASIPLDKLGIVPNDHTYVTVKVNPEARGGFEVENNRDKSYYQEIKISRVSDFTDKYEGEFKKIDHVKLEDITDLTQIKKLGKALSPLGELITLENHCQAILQGLLSATEGVKVLTEPNYSREGKPDLLVTYKKDGVTHVTVGEIKFANGEGNIEQKRAEGKNQLKKRADGLEAITKEKKKLKQQF